MTNKQLDCKNQRNSFFFFCLKLFGKIAEIFRFKIKKKFCRKCKVLTENYFRFFTGNRNIVLMTHHQSSQHLFCNFSPSSNRRFASKSIVITDVRGKVIFHSCLSFCPQGYSYPMMLVDRTPPSRTDQPARIRKEAGPRPSFLVGSAGKDWSGRRLPRKD